MKNMGRPNNWDDDTLFLWWRVYGPHNAERYIGVPLALSEVWAELRQRGLLEKANAIEAEERAKKQEGGGR